MNRVGIVLTGRYELIELLGSGGMADVYKASDRKLNRYVAVKILRHEYSNDENFIIRFQQEAMAAASIQNPFVVNVYDVGIENDINYIVMELAEGITLKEYIQKKGKLEIVEAINIAVQIVNGIREAHMHGIIHRDIKPQNVMVSSNGRIKVMDFGIAKAVTAQTITANTVGSVHYISPEQARGSACDERCDIYSIGITMYEMITGRVPFDGDSTVAIALAHIKEPITPPSVYEPMIPVSLEKIIMKCTQKKPELRYASADELIDDLKKALMTPDEDFVKEVIIPQEGGTRIFSDEDTRKIKEETDRQTVAVKTQEEEDYQLGLEDDELDDLPAEEEESDGKMEKVVLGVGIGALLVVLLIAGLLIARAFNLFSPSGEVKETESIGSGTLAADEVFMPHVAGETLEEAKKILNDAGLGCEKVVRQASNEVANGLVISASEEEGAVLKKNSQVILYVSSGKETVLIPENIIGSTEAAAKNALEKQGLKVKSEPGLDDTVNVGEVYKCDPGAGQPVKVGTEVTIYVSTGKTTVNVKVPNLVNQPEETAKMYLEHANLKGDRQEKYDSEVEAGRVISQDPVAGEEVPEGSTITYYVSKGPETRTVKVPGVLGLTQEAAIASLKAENLVARISEDYDDTVAKGKVIRQSIDEGEEVEEGTAIELVISLGPEVTYSTVPNIVGYTEEEAKQKLAENNLTGSKIGEESSSTVPAGQIIRMDHDVGEEVEPGSTIGYVVSSGEAETEPTVGEDE